MEIQQSDLYAEYIKRLKWDAEKIDNVWIYSKRIPFYGGLAKIQRPDILPDKKILTTYLRLHKLKKIALEPSENITQSDLNEYIKHLKNQNFSINSSPFLCTKTVRVDLSKTENEMFASFSEAKRRAVRKALKNNISVEISDNIKDLIKIKSKSAGMFGSMTTYGLDRMWEIFSPNNAAVFLAFNKSTKPILLGGVLLVWFDKIAYYWIAGALKDGKKLFAPTLLVWESIKYAKQKNNKLYDFIGVWDERIPKQNTSFKGFTRFKIGFTKNSLYYPISIS